MRGWVWSSARSRRKSGRTGLGEAILKVALARAACIRVRDGLSPREAAIAAVGLLRERAHGDGGIIIAGPDGRLGSVYNTARTSRALVRAGMARALAAV
jgi:isoaspartyl peptidase/L-asparaginase-like protein (Ntn-hydrolase superfamily)